MVKGPFVLLALVLALPRCQAGGVGAPQGFGWMDSLIKALPQSEALPDALSPPPGLPHNQDAAEALLRQRDACLPLYADSTVLALAHWHAGPGWADWVRLRRAARPAMDQAAQELALRKLPLDLALLPMVLAGGRSTAGSPFGQAGPWRLDLATALRHGLVVDARRDERRELASATRAALDRLQDLLVQHGGRWEDALVAFACGPANLARARSLAGEKADLPTLARSVAPSERGILPLFMAFLLLESASPQASFWPALSWEAAPVARDLAVAAPVETPATMSDRRSQTDGTGRAVPHRITVRSGDTLEALARRHGVRIRDLKRWNGLRGDLIRPGQRLRITDGAPSPAGLEFRDRGGEGGGDASTNPARRLNERGGKATFRWYTVRQGDTLYDIAAAHSGVRVNDIMDLNKITARIQPGQRIRIPLP